MKRFWAVLVVLACVLTLAVPVAAAPVRPPKILQQTVPITLRIPDNELIVVVQAGDKFVTFYSRPEGVTKEVPVANHYTFWAANCVQENILVLDANKKLVGHSYWPGEPLTIGRADNVPPSTEYWVLKQILPSEPTSLGEIPQPAAGTMTLMIPDPRLVVVVQAGDQFDTYYSRPEGVNQVVAGGPYTFWGTNCWPKDLLVFDSNLVLVGASWWPGEPYTQHRVENIPSGMLYWVIRESIPDFVP